jgi:hypothetical protein
MDEHGLNMLCSRVYAARGAARAASREPGVVVIVNERVVSILGFTVRDGRILAIDALADPDRLRNLDLSALD